MLEGPNTNPMGEATVYGERFDLFLCAMSNGIFSIIGKVNKKKAHATSMNNGDYQKKAYLTAEWSDCFSSITKYYFIGFEYNFYGYSV
eukprot:snap_masked-scaffold_7-processed-gene-2.36-mRNA-1 protein AED:1.00 eAED:1.00 QI:0/0/0/0/1/1/2/0/87